jgi:hypothetical protein
MEWVPADEDQFQRQLWYRGVTRQCSRTMDQLLVGLNSSLGSLLEVAGVRRGAAHRRANKKRSVNL